MDVTWLDTFIDCPIIYNVSWFTAQSSVVVVCIQLVHVCPCYVKI